MTRGTTRAMRVVESNTRPAHRGLKTEASNTDRLVRQAASGCDLPDRAPAREGGAGWSPARSHPDAEDGVAPAGKRQQELALHHYEIASGRFSLPRTTEDVAMPCF